MSVVSSKTIKPQNAKQENLLKICS